MTDTRLDPDLTATSPQIPDLVRVFGRIGLLSFGGPAAQIALMHKELVEDRAWLTEKQYLQARSFCMLLPGPEAMQLATYAGWRVAGVAGGLIGGLLFVIPGALVILALAALYAVGRGDVPELGKHSLSPPTLEGLEAGDRLVIRSLNGATCVRVAGRVPMLLVGALVNASAVAAATSVRECTKSLPPGAAPPAWSVSTPINASPAMSGSAA